MIQDCQSCQSQCSKRNVQCAKLENNRLPLTRLRKRPPPRCCRRPAPRGPPVPSGSDRPHLCMLRHIPEQHEAMTSECECEGHMVVRSVKEYMQPYLAATCDYCVLAVLDHITQRQIRSRLLSGGSAKKLPGLILNNEGHRENVQSSPSVPVYKQERNVGGSYYEMEYLVTNAAIH